VVPLREVVAGVGQSEELWPVLGGGCAQSPEASESELQRREGKGEGGGRSPEDAMDEVDLRVCLEQDRSTRHL
jgi:hypothetical protein